MPILTAAELRTCMDAAFAEAERQGARPFRLELQEAEIDRLLETGVLEPKAAEMDTSRGRYRGVRAYPAVKESELMAQPPDRFEGLHLPLYEPEPKRLRG